MNSARCPILLLWSHFDARVAKEGASDLGGDGAVDGELELDADIHASHATASADHARLADEEADFDGVDVARVGRH